MFCDCFMAPNYEAGPVSLYKKGTRGNDQEMAQSERNSHSINRGVGKTKMILRYLYQENI